MDERSKMGEEKSVKRTLVDRLSAPGTKVALRLRSENTAEAFRARIQIGQVYLRFAGLRGMTELGITLDEHATDTKQADFQNGTGSVHLEGLVTLNGENMQCIADIDLNTLSGTGYLRQKPATVLASLSGNTF